MNGALLQATHTTAMHAAAATPAMTRHATLWETLKRSGMRLARSTRYGARNVPSTKMTLGCVNTSATSPTTNSAAHAPRRLRETPCSKIPRKANAAAGISDSETRLGSSGPNVMKRHG